VLDLRATIQTTARIRITSRPRPVKVIGIICGESSLSIMLRDAQVA
jgi:hypothetical protein